VSRISKNDLLKLQKTLKTDAGIGAKFGISRQAVHQIRLKYGIKANTLKNAGRNDTIVKRYIKGVPVTVIAGQSDLSIAQVYRIIQNKRGR
jgi:hypothetical protein